MKKVKIFGMNPIRHIAGGGLDPADIQKEINGWLKEMDDKIEIMSILQSLSTEDIAISIFYREL